MKSLSIIGCGKVGRTLAALWLKEKQVILHEVVNTSLASAKDACSFLRAGKPVAEIENLERAQIILIATKDNAISDVVGKLVELELNEAVVIHCSGALSSEVLAPLRVKGASIASVHPLHSFSNPEESLHKFAGTFCGIEGDGKAVSMVRPLFEAIGGVIFSLQSENKALYHAATVFASNYIVALLDVAVQCMRKSGIGDEIALKIIEPLLLRNAARVFSAGTEKSLTGPIARGDIETVEKHLDSLRREVPSFVSLYQELGGIALRITEEKGGLSSALLRRCAQVLAK